MFKNYPPSPRTSTRTSRRPQIIIPPQPLTAPSERDKARLLPYFPTSHLNQDCDFSRLLSDFAQAVSELDSFKLGSNPLTPKVKASERMFCWSGPSIPSQGHLIINHPVITHLQKLATKNAWAPATLETYSSALPKFMEFCDKMGIPHDQRFPMTPQLVSSFVLWASGPKDSYPGALGPKKEIAVSTATGYVSAFHAWHLIQGYPWVWDDKPHELVLWSRGLARLQGNSHKKPPRPAITLQMISLLIDNLSHDDCFDAAVLACALVTFFSLFRLGETTVRSVRNYDPLDAITRKDVVYHLSPDGIPFYKILLRHDKTLDVSDIRILRFVQLRVGKWWIMDLVNNHLARNLSSDPDAHFFGYFSSKSKSFRPLTKDAYITHVNQVWSTFGYPHITGHSHRIGGASLMLNLGFEIEFIRIIGRWKSISYALYLRLLDEFIPNSLAKITFLIDMKKRSQFTPSLTSNPQVIKDLAILEQSYLDTFQQSSSPKGRNIAKKVEATQSRSIKERNGQK
ncbi:hypothetical protein BT69DRAFT_1249148 [Atractiella rhizophila]|nr:hypothetical protein BT69DRAFT_1249148 [Atractiella rhizophila]